MSSSRPIKKAKTQRTLRESMGLHALPKDTVDGTNMTPSNPTVIQGEVSEKKKHRRVFLESWKFDHPWVYCVIDSTGSERVKCKWCTYAHKPTPFAEAEGSKSLQKIALRVHENSDEHREAKSMWKEHEKRTMVPMPKYVEEMHNAEKERIVTCMQIAWYVLKRYMPIEEDTKQCGFHKFIGTPNMPVVNEYSSYVSKDAAKQFGKAIRHVYWEKLRRNICNSPWYALQVDESTDICTTQYVILYVTYIENGGNGDVCTKFADLLHPKSASAECLFDVLMMYLKEEGLPIQKLIAIATDGATVMTRQHTGLCARLKEKVPHLMSFHCIAHRQALAAGDAFKTYKEFKYVDKIARKMYEWTSRSAKRHAFLGEVIKSFGIGRRGKLRVQKMHDVRWLSKGQVMVSIVRIMPALLTALKSEDIDLYGYLANYKVQFLLHFFADVLSELNVLNCTFQEECPDIASIGGHIKSVMETLRLAFFGVKFAGDTRYTDDFLKKVHAQKGLMMLKDNADVLHSHCLHLGSMYEGDVADPRESFDSVNSHMIFICQSYLQSLVNALWDRFKNDFDVFEASKYFSPKDYDNDLEKLDVCSKEWLQVLCKRFGQGSNPIIGEQECMGERRSFQFCYKDEELLQGKKYA
ncbi:hypothetical protein L7F22_040451 [Adiantum nelumboides]|nr:hypothetical protein [Adiantum nelumboides]